MTHARPVLKPRRNPPRPAGNVVSIRPSPAPKPAPKHLPAPERALWREIVSNYVVDDGAACEVLAVALEARARMRKCRQQIDNDGEAIRDRWNQVRAHPLLVAERGARDSYLSALRLLSLDLSSATR
jgi:hypothetical protein